MSSFDRRTLLILPLALAACGFSPTLAPGTAAAGLIGKIRAADPTDKAGYDFVAALEARLGRPASPLYDLAYTIRTKAIGVGITPEGAILRYHLTGSLDWTLTRRSDGQRVTGGLAESFTAYSATGTTVATLAAQSDAEARLMTILADQIALRLQSTASAWAS